MESQYSNHEFDCHQIIARNIATAIRWAQLHNTTGMSLANIKAMTTTCGVTCKPHEYDGDFNALAIEEAKRLQFDIIN